MKIAILEANAVNPGDLSWECLKQFGEIAVYADTPEEEAVSQIGDAEIVLINKTPITTELLDACPNIRLICVQATGFNVVDCAAAKARGVVVCNVPAYSTNSVAQMTFALLLEICNQVGHHSNLVHSGEWQKRNIFTFWDTPQTELFGKTIGIIGFGMIGRAVGKIANAFGMRVLAYNRSRCAEGESIGTYVDLDTLLTESDIISIHCPLTPETAGIINKNSIAKMKDGAILLNTARGGMLNEADVAQALHSRKLRYAAVDVVSEEPISESNPLYSAPNCIITPHMAWTPIEARQRIIDCTQRNIAGFLYGKPVNVVNK